MNGWNGAPPGGWEETIALALSEDIGTGDLTAAIFDPEQSSKGYIEAQASGVICGVGIAESIFADYAGVSVKPLLEDGATVKAGTKVLQLSGPTAALLTHERVALNFLMQLSGVATLTRRFVDEVAGTRARIVDTRKTTPGLRSLQKYAVRCGGGHNHRMGLYDAPMIKDNHIAAAGSIKDAVAKMRANMPHTAKIEVEVDSPDQVQEAVDSGAEIILLDNMPPAMMAAIVRQYEGLPVIFEASGGINLETVRSVAESGVHVISVGALTHSAPSLSLHLELE